MEDDAQQIPFDENIAWNDIKNAARRLFDVWVTGGEYEWAEECWGHLTKCGLTRGVGIVDRTATYLRLITLARVYEEFSGIIWDENPETPLDMMAEDLEIDPIALGILAAATSREELEEFAINDELREAAMQIVIDAQRGEICTCLSAAYGGAPRLYSRMFKTNADSDDDDDGEEFEVTDTNSAALQYVMNGFQSG
jgi:hypothetical protein